MKIKLTPDTDKAHELLALQAYVDTLVEHRLGQIKVTELTYEDRGIDQANGPTTVPDIKDITVWTTEENEELAKANLSVTDDIGEVAYNTIGGKPEAADAAGVAVDVKSPEEIAEEVASKADAAAEKKAKAAAKKEAAAKKRAEAKAAKEAAAKVDVETPKVSVADASIDEALAELDPPKPEKTEEPVDASAVRAAMVEIVKAHGPKGAKMASTIVHEIAGVKDATKIPPGKLQEVVDGLKAAATSANAEPEPPAAVVEEPVAEPVADAPEPDAATSAEDDLDF